MPMLQVREQQQQQSKVFTFTGAFNRDSTRGIQARILAAHEMDCQHIVLDFSGVTEIDSTGFGELFRWYHNMCTHRVHISIVKPQDHVGAHLDWSHISEIVAIYESQQEAVEFAGYCA